MFLIWPSLEPAKGRFAPNIVGAYTDIVARLSAAGVRANFVFTGSPPWASGSSDFNAAPRNPADYADALARFAALPGIAGHNIAYELWNEEDADEWWAPKADPAAYAALVKAAAPALRAADPTAQVVLGPLTGNDFPWLEQLYAHGIQGSFDAAAVHLDTGCLVNGPATVLRDRDGRISQYVFLGVREVLATMRAHGDNKPVRVTEYGWSSTQPASGGGPSCERGASAGLKPSGVTPAEQATFLAQGYHCLAQEPGVETATWFTLRDAPVSEHPLDELRHYGLLTTGGAHKPAWDVFHAIATGGDTLSGACGDFDGPAVTVVTPKVGQAYAGSLLISASARDTGGPAPDHLRRRRQDDPELRRRPGQRQGRLAGLAGRQGSCRSASTRSRSARPTPRATSPARTSRCARSAASQLIAIGPAKFTLKAVKCSKAASCLLSGQLLSPSGSPLPGKVQIQWQWRTKATKKRKAAWKTLHKVTKPAGKPFKVRQKLKRSGAWRVRVRYLAPKPLKPSSSKWAYFSVKSQEVALGATDLQHHAVHAARRLGDPVGMQRVGERLQAVDQPRARPAEVGGGVERDDLLGAQRAQAVAELLGLGQRARAVVAARDADDDLGLGGLQELPLQLLGVLAGEAEQVGPAGHVDQLRRPVAGDEDRVEPLDRDHAAPARALERDPHAVDAGALAGDEVQRGVARVGRLGERPDVAHRLAERLGVQRDDVGAGVELLGDVADLLVGDRADRAQLLGDDQVGLQLGELLLVEEVDRLALLGALAHGRVDLARR